jgi:AraC-like DNA-binding protein
MAHWITVFCALKKPPSNRFSMVAEQAPRWGDFHFRAAVVSDAELAAALQRLFRAIEAGSALLEKESRLSGICTILMARHCERVGTAHSPGITVSIQKAREILIERYSEDLSLNALASAAGVSRFHLVSAFRKRYGLPPHAFQLAVRIEKAKSMLADGMTGTEIAHALGFADHAHLIRQFKRSHGVSPRSFANMVHRV